MYPIAFALDHESENRNRLTTFFRAIVAIPWEIVASLWGLAAYVVTFIAWFALLFTGRYPQGMYDFNAKYLRMYTRVNGFYLLATDAWPPFHGDPDDAYPVRVGIAPPKAEYSRLKVLFRIIIGIPVYLLALIQGLIAFVIAIVAWFAILFTGRFSEGLYNPLRGALAYTTRAGSYFLLMTEDYPPFSYDEAVEQPQLASGSGPGITAPAPQQEERPPGQP
jgi:Domain of unknown function (DUF4389)